MNSRVCLQRRVLSLALVMATSLGPALSQTTVLITEFTVPTADSFPYGITAGPDGALWFTEKNANKIGRITPKGAITEYIIPPLALGGGSPSDITLGPDGALWFGDVLHIGRITTAGAITHYETDPGQQGRSITTGPDGALWFTEFNVSRIGRITVSGSYGSPYGQADAFFRGITAGPDGALWITVGGAPPDFTNIRRITTSGIVTAEYSVDGNLVGITAGPDGALWFTDNGRDKIGRITTSGTITTYALPRGSRPAASPESITTGPDGALWFTEFAGNNIGRITTSGVITRFEIPTTSDSNSCPFDSSGPQSIAAGPNGSIWFTESCGNKIGRLFLVPTTIPALLSFLESLGLPHGTQTSLMAKLNAAQRSSDRGNMKAACNQLNAFVNEVNGLSLNGGVDGPTALALVEGANAIRSSLGCPL